MNAPTAEEHLGLVHLCANRFRGEAWNMKTSILPAASAY